MRHGYSWSQHALLNPGAAEERVEAARVALAELQAQYERDLSFAPDPVRLKALQAQIRQAAQAVSAAESVLFASKRRDRARGYLRSLPEIPRTITQKEAGPFARKERMAVRDAVSLLRGVLREPEFDVDVPEPLFEPVRLDLQTLMQQKPERPSLRPRPQVALLSGQPAWVKQAAFDALRGLGPAADFVDVPSLRDAMFNEWLRSNLFRLDDRGVVKRDAVQGGAKQLTKELRAIAAPTIREARKQKELQVDLPQNVRDIFAAQARFGGEWSLGLGTGPQLVRDVGSEWPVLEELKKGPEMDQLRAALIETHLGLPGGLPIFRTQGQRVRAQQDAAEYHGLISTAEGSCPTCAYISRKSNFPGVNPESLGNLMEWWAFTRQARTPVVVG